MHCASCEILIEKKLLDLKNIKSADASTAKGQVVVEYEVSRPAPKELNKLFREENYRFSDFNRQSAEGTEAVAKEGKDRANPTLVAFNIAMLIVVAFLFLDKIGISGFLSVNSSSSLAAFFGFGILASLSSCAALVGGIILSMSKQWAELYGENSPAIKKIQPNVMFTLGRIISYGIFGAILGAAGSKLQISLQFTSVLIIAMSLFMFALGLQMLGIKFFRRFQLSLPKSVTRYVANENNFKGKYFPFLMGATTFILPCGFTITTEGLALLSGSVFLGAMIMLAFVLGTTPILFSIGFSSAKFLAKPHLAERFSKVAGFLVLFFALFNISAQMNVLGFSVFNLLPSRVQSPAAGQSGLPPIVNGKQVIKMTAYASSDDPNYFKVMAGIPVRWEILADGARGCNSSIVAAGLFPDQIPMVAGQTSAKEFTPEKPGKYRFSCTMGMVAGTIEVVN